MTNLTDYAQTHGIPYEQFIKEEMEDRLELQRQGKTIDDFDQYIELNYRRSLRVTKQITLTQEIKNTLQSIPFPLIWMVLTEAWCGDSAQSLPVIATLADHSPNIDLKILLRDDHLEIMDMFLTNGSRGIPKLIALDSEGNVLFTWGPRPQPAVQLFQEEKAKGTPKQDIYVKLHTWYGRDKGNTIMAELLSAIEQSAKTKTV
ncbi:MAG: thioredoxin family protein [Calditrichia bacterium]